MVRFIAFVVAVMVFFLKSIRKKSGASTPAAVRRTQSLPRTHNTPVTMQKLRDRRVVLRGMIDKGEIGLVGAMYDVSSGKVVFYE